METADITQTAETFILAGNATFTLLNTRTQNRLTYKVSQCADKPSLYFVAVLTGPDNEQDYRYLGTIFLGHAQPASGCYWQYRHGAKSKISPEAQSAKAFSWFWEHRGQLPEAVQVYHEGTCGRCGRKLTTPESVSRGIGPECIKHLGA